VDPDRMAAANRGGRIYCDRCVDALRKTLGSLL